MLFLVLKAAVQDRLNEQEGVPSVFNPPPSRPLQVNTADHRIYSYVVSRPQPRASYLTEDFVLFLCLLCGRQDIQIEKGIVFFISCYLLSECFFLLKTKCRATPSATVTSVAIFSVV